VPNLIRKMSIVVLSTSLDPKSQSRFLAKYANDWLGKSGRTSSLIDMREYPLIDFDNNEIFKQEYFIKLKRQIAEASSVIIASPVYNWGYCSQLKKVIECTGAHSPSAGLTSAWFDKIVTFICSGGTYHSYMAFSSMAVSLMLDFKCIINPHMAYALADDFEADHPSNRFQARLDRVLNIKCELLDLLASRKLHSTWEV